MKFITNSIDFSAALQTAMLAVSARSTMPALECVLIETQGENTITLTGSDGNMRISCALPCTVLEEGSALLRGKTFEEIARKFPHGEITAQSDSRNVVTIKSGRVKARLSGIDHAEYPAHDATEPVATLPIPANQFCALISSVEACIATDEKRPVLCGGCLDAADGTLTMVGLDGFRLGLRSISDQAYEANPSTRIIVPARSLGVLKRLISRIGSECVTLRISSNELSISHDMTEFSCRLIEGEYINYRSIIPKSFNTTVQVNASNMRAAVERLIAIAEQNGKNGRLMNLTISSDGGFSLHGQSDAGDILETLDALVTGNDLSINFNSLYFLDALKLFDRGDLLISFGSSVSPCIIRYAPGTDAEADELLWLILPVRR